MSQDTVTGLVCPDSDTNTDVPRTAPIPPSNSSKELRQILEHVSTYGEEVGVIDEALGKLQSLLQSERQRWAKELVARIPEVYDNELNTDKFGDSAVFRQGVRWCGDQVLNIIKEAGK